MTWDDFANLSAAQKNKAAQFAAIGQAVQLYRRGGGPLPDISAVTQSQAKAARAIFDDMQALVGPASIGVAWVIQKNYEAQLAAYEQANP